MVRVGDPGPRPVHLLFSEPTGPFGDDPTLDFLVKARGSGWASRPWCGQWDGDGLDTFLSTPAEDFRGWEGARAGGPWNTRPPCPFGTGTVCPDADGGGELCLPRSRQAWGGNAAVLQGGHF
ncbi:DUF6228 family protein [Streptomyces sp. NPDC127084]|uniref:DUF6228 family protein n=1 Tax=Streptomyces sp. NPDC127084 TaxID=3347133 RepID=UPI0036650B80